MPQEITIYHIAIAGLLHDIGKLVDRAKYAKEAPGVNDYLNRCQQRKNKKGNTYYAYGHAKWAEWFIRKFIMDRVPENKQDTWDLIATLAASHHRTESITDPNIRKVAELIQYGDRLQASTDREQAVWGWAYLRRPLYSPLNVIHFGSQTENISWQLPLQSIDYKQYQSMNLENESLDYKKPKYRNVYDNFVKDLEFIIDEYKNDKLNLRQMTDALDSIIEKHCWAIPANTIEANPMTSLHMHSKVTAAFAACLWMLHTKYPEVTVGELSVKKDGLLLLGGDICGIQDYLYDFNPEHSKGVAKSLRARSIKVKMMSDLAIRTILKQLDLPNQCILMDAGGKFLVLLPNTEKVIEVLTECKEKIEHDFFKEYQGQLAFNLNWETKITVEDLQQHNFHLTLQRFISNLSKTKLHKFESVLHDKEGWNYNNFIIQSTLRVGEICEYCHHEAGISKDDAIIGDRCKNDLSVGRELPKNSKFSIRYGKDSKNNNAVIGLKNLEVAIHTEPSLVSLSPEYDYFQIKGSDQIHIPTRPIATFVPHGKGKEVMEFLDIASKAVTDGLGTPLLAVLKGDVDNLGKAFIQGLISYEDNKQASKDNKQTPEVKKQASLNITKYLYSSWLIDRFFSQYLPALIEQEFPNLYLVYAGGDDFCLVGPWNEVIDFSYRLQEDFIKFHQNDSNLHFSAAITLMSGNSPIKNAIQLCDRELQIVKTPPNCNKDTANKEGSNTSIESDNAQTSKNAIRLFGITCPWSEFPKVMEQCNNFHKWIKEGEQPEKANKKAAFSVQFLYRLLQYYESYVRFQEKSMIQDLLYKAHLSYDLNRNFGNYKEAEYYKMLKLMISEDSKWEYIKIPICYAIYQNRKANHNKEA